MQVSGAIVVLLANKHEHAESVKIQVAESGCNAHCNTHCNTNCNAHCNINYMPRMSHESCVLAGDTTTRYEFVLIDVWKLL